MTASMDWNEIVVTSWQEFTDALEPVLDRYNVPPTYVFRGQSDSSWLLEPSLLRQVRKVGNRVVAREIEELLETEFKAQAPLFPETESVWLALIAAGRTELWAYMQHHDCPTRLLDWTASAFVGAYFAVDQLPKTDGSLFVVAPAALERHIKKCNPSMAKSLTICLSIPIHRSASFSRGRISGPGERWRNKGTSVSVRTSWRLTTDPYLKHAQESLERRRDTSDTEGSGRMLWAEGKLNIGNSG